MALSPLLLLLSALSVLLAVSVSVSGVVMFEEGYTVNTMLDGNKVHINPHLVVSVPGSSDLIVLDSAGSSFYTLLLSQQENTVKPLAGKGTGFSDGDLASAKFEKPRSFAVDFSGNIYVADRGNLAIRKISSSGVSTIAGGYSTTPGHADGPGKNATFSSDFELTFVPESCALMICDHGSKLIRKINLKPRDCAKGSQSVLSASAWVWALLLGVSCLVGSVIGFAIRPFVTLNTGNSQPVPLRHDMEAFPNPSGETATDTLLRHQKRNLKFPSFIHRKKYPRSQEKSSILHQKPVSLLDFDVVDRKETKSFNDFDEQLKDLINFEDSVQFQDHNAIINDDENGDDVNSLSFDGHRRIDNMIEANMIGFVEKAKKVPLEEPFISSYGLVKRR